ncbi:hypothetical protein HYH02_012951 [Chlamydomonas schloesseri]|uniref:Uncharacterized protein n=1 Tax=Chlamydomonas schloesseri TaxID=2026947 RepID=A0A835T213_9CHLO|nr:hypothetical protein HYH02_012951 [Chlamydomonas schloesseri]|eukprot:KAG2432379.1 hypothetical protein HYH02_012951 [Chlamydomonas schloesseri]
MEEIRRRNASREALAAAGRALIAQDMCSADAASEGPRLLHSFSSDLERPLPPHLPQPPPLHPLRSHTPQPHHSQQPPLQQQVPVPAPAAAAHPQAPQAALAGLATAASAPASDAAALAPGTWGAPGLPSDSHLGVAPLSWPSYSALPTDSGGSGGGGGSSLQVPHALIELVACPSSGDMGAATAAGEAGASSPRSVCGAAGLEPAASDTLLDGLLATVLSRQKSVSNRFMMQSRKVKDQDADELVDEHLPDLAAQAAAEAAEREQDQAEEAGHAGHAEHAGLRRSLSRSHSRRSNNGRRSLPARSHSPSPGRKFAPGRTQSQLNSTNGMGGSCTSSTGVGGAAVTAAGTAAAALAPSASFAAPGAWCLPRCTSSRFCPTPPAAGPPPASTNSTSGTTSSAAQQPLADMASFQQTRRQRLQQPLRPQASTGSGCGVRGGGGNGGDSSGGWPGSTGGLVSRSASSFTRMPPSRLVMAGVSHSLDGSAWTSAEGAVAAAAALAGDARPHTPRLQVPEPDGEGIQLPRLLSASPGSAAITAAAAAAAAAATAAPAGGATAAVATRGLLVPGVIGPTSAWSAPGASPSSESGNSGSGRAFSPQMRSTGSRSRFQSPSSGRRLVPTAASGAGGAVGTGAGSRCGSPSGFVPLTQGQSWWAKSTVARELVFLK